MAKPRKEQINLNNTHYYHIISRCVRRAFLCGKQQDGKTYEHRREWIEQRILFLTNIFSIRVASYAVMSNHYHIVVKISPNASDTLSDIDTLKTWANVYQLPLIAQQFLTNPSSLNKTQLETVQRIAKVYRKRLDNISWFMKCLNEPIARLANKEDKCTGHFWESRFKSQPLNTEQALLTCMAYVDLNPIRADMCKTLEASDFTSIKLRISSVKNIETNQPIEISHHLISFYSENNNESLPITFEDYIKLVEDTGKQYRPGKKGKLHDNLPSIVDTLN